MRLRALFAPEFGYGYLLDACAVEMAAAITDSQEKRRKRITYDRALRSELTVLYDTWNRTLWRRPHRAEVGVERLRWPRAVDDHTCLSLIVDASLTAPFGHARIDVSDAQRQQALRRLAQRLEVDESWVIRALELGHDARRAHPRRRDMTRLKRAAMLAGGIGLVSMTAGTALPAMIGAHVGLSGTAATNYGLAWLGHGSLASGGYGIQGGHWLLQGGHAVGHKMARRAVTSASDRSSRASVLAALGPDLVIEDLIRLQTHVVLVDHEAFEDREAVQTSIEQLAEARGEVQDEIATLRERGRGRSDELKNAQQVEQALERALTWLITRT